MTLGLTVWYAWCKECGGIFAYDRQEPDAFGFVMAPTDLLCDLCLEITTKSLGWVIEKEQRRIAALSSI